MKKKLINIALGTSNALLLTLVFLLPWQTRLILKTNDIGYLEISLYAVDLLIVLLFLVRILNNNFRISNFEFRIYKLKTPSFWLLAFVLWSIVSILWASDKILAMQHVFWLLLAMGLGWLVYNAEDIRKITFWFSVGLILPAWLAIWQFTTQSTFANKWLGIAMHKAALGGASVIETLVNGHSFRWLRAYGSFDHPNILGAVMSIGIIVLIAECVLSIKCKGEARCHPEFISGSGDMLKRNIGPETSSGRHDCMSFMLRVFASIILTSFAAACFLGFSRSAWAGLILGLSGVGFFLLRNSLRNSMLKYIKTLVMIAAVFLVLGIAYRDVVLVRTDRSARLERKSLDDRAIYFQQSKEIIKSNSLLGVGAGNYVKSLKNENPSAPSWTYQPVHNVFMLTWAELGLVGLLAFVALCGTIITRAFRNNPIGFCLLLTLLPAMFLDHWLWSLHFGLLFFGLIIGFTLNKRL